MSKRERIPSVCSCSIDCKESMERNHECRGCKSRAKSVAWNCYQAYRKCSECEISASKNTEAGGGTTESHLRHPSKKQAHAAKPASPRETIQQREHSGKGGRKAENKAVDKHLELKNAANIKDLPDEVEKETTHNADAKIGRKQPEKSAPKGWKCFCNLEHECCWDADDPDALDVVKCSTKVCNCTIASKCLQANALSRCILCIRFEDSDNQAEDANDSGNANSSQAGEKTQRAKTEAGPDVPSSDDSSHYNDASVADGNLNSAEDSEQNMSGGEDDRSDVSCITNSTNGTSRPKQDLQIFPDPESVARYFSTKSSAPTKGDIERPTERETKNS